MSTLHRLRTLPASLSPRFAAPAMVLVTVLTATAGAVAAFRLWRLDPHIPLQYSYDALLHLGFVQNMVETGWYLEGPRLGAPFGQHHYDYTLGPDNAHLLILRGLTALTGDAPASVNLFFLLTFPLAALTCLWALRRYHVPPLVAMFGAVTFALLPYHLTRDTGHLFLAAYYTVPISCYAIIGTLEGRRFFGLGRPAAAGDRPRLERLRDIAGPAGLALLIASGGAYYAVFTLALLAPATLLGSLRTRSRRLLLSGSLMAVLTVAFLGLNSLPTFLYRLDHGTNQDVPVRAEVETERHGLRPAALVLPIEGHRLAPFAAIAGRYAAFPAVGEQGESLGTVGAAGLVGLLVVGVGALTGACARGRRWRRHRGLAALTAISLGLAVTGGGSTLIALLVSPQIRAWARLSIFIGFFSLLAVCLVLGMLWRRARHTRWRPTMAVAVVALLIGAVLDQTTDLYVPDYGAIRQEFLADGAFVEAVEQALPDGAAIYMLPYLVYPEAGPREQLVDYDPMRAYLQSRHLRWSYGGIKGREAGWQLFVQGRQLTAQLPVAAAAGFSAVWLDRWAYPSGAALIEPSLREALGDAMLESASERYAVYDLQPYAGGNRTELGDAQWAALGEALLAPVWVRWRDGVERGVPEGCRLQRVAAAHARLALVNDGVDGRQQVVSFGLWVAHGPPLRVDVTWPDGTVERLSASVEPIKVQRTVDLAAGDNLIELVADSAAVAGHGPGDPSRLRVSDVWTLEPQLLAMAGSDALC